MQDYRGKTLSTPRTLHRTGQKPFVNPVAISRTPGLAHNPPKPAHPWLTSAGAPEGKLCRGLHDPNPSEQPNMELGHGIGVGWAGWGAALGVLQDRAGQELLPSSCPIHQLPALPFQGCTRRTFCRMREAFLWSNSCSGRAVLPVLYPAALSALSNPHLLLLRRTRPGLCGSFVLLAFPSHQLCGLCPAPVPPWLSWSIPTDL